MAAALSAELKALSANFNKAVAGNGDSVSLQTASGAKLTVVFDSAAKRVKIDPPTPSPAVVAAISAAPVAEKKKPGRPPKAEKPADSKNIYLVGPYKKKLGELFEKYKAAGKTEYIDDEFKSMLGDSDLYKEVMNFFKSKTTDEKLISARLVTYYKQFVAGDFNKVPRAPPLKKPTEEEKPAESSDDDSE